MIVLGIDPGVSGAVAAVDSRGSCVIEDIPTLKMPGTGRTQFKVSGRGLAELVRRLVPPGESCLVLLEDVHAMPSSKSGGGANTSLMHSKGVIEGVLGVLRLDITLVYSQTWKRFYGLDADKDKALDMARRLYPNAQHLLTRKRDHNRAESLLIAHYGARKLT